MSTKQTAALGRGCVACGTRLAADNEQDRCSPCARNLDKVRVRPRSPHDSFWTSPGVGRAVRRRDFGQLLRLWRTTRQPTVTQLEVATLLGLSQAQVSRIESGRTKVVDLDKLVRWARILGAPNGHLWFTIPDDSEGIRHANTAFGKGLPIKLDAALISGDSDDRSFERPSYAASSTIGPEDVVVVREATAAFRQIDNRYGGGRARAAVSAFLDTEVSTALADARFSRGTRAPFEQAAAEMYQLAGWMSYDVGDERLGRSHLRRALEIAISAADDALTAEMLSAMSHQAAFFGRGGETVDLALAARRAAQRSGVPALQAESAVLEAQGLALVRDSRGSIAALERAERHFFMATAENTPEWLSYFDRAYLSAKFAQTLLDLGLSGDAERFARDSLRMSEGYERGRLFNTALLSSVLAENGEVDEAVTVARDAVSMAGRVRSARAGRYLRDIDLRLHEVHVEPAVASLRRDMLAMGVDLRQ
jgi:transcriptional regulator with XRE-family HTH domain